MADEVPVGSLLQYMACGWPDVVESYAGLQERGAFLKELKDKSALSHWYAKRGPEGILSKTYTGFI